MIDGIPNINLNLKALETSIEMTEKSYFKLAEKEYEYVRVWRHSVVTQHQFQNV